MADLSRSPSEVVSILQQFRQNSDDEQLLNTLTNVVADPAYWEYLRDERIVDLFTALILNRATQRINSQNPFPSWVLPLQGLFNVMVGMRRSSSGFSDQRNRETLVKYLSNCPQICEFLYSEAYHICRSEEYAEHIRRTLVAWIQAIWNGTGMMDLDQIKNRLKGSHIITLSTWCWLYTTTPTLRSTATSSLSDILEQPITSNADLDEVITACGSSERLVEAINHLLCDENVLHESLAYSLGLAIAFTGQTIRPDLIQEFSSMNTTTYTMAALRRQLCSVEETSDDTWRIIDYSGMLIVNVINDSKSPTEEITRLISKYSLIPLLASLLIRFVQASKSGDTWLSLLTLLKHTCTCTSNSCRIRTSPEYLSALRTHLTWRWWPTLKRLYAAPESEAASKLRNEWFSLGREAGLKRENEMQRHENGVGIQGCWSVECPSLVDPCDPADNPNLRRCSACKKALYCSSACQSKDWKEHKSKCTTWKIGK